MNNNNYIIIFFKIIIIIIIIGLISELSVWVAIKAIKIYFLMNNTI